MEDEEKEVTSGRERVDDKKGVALVGKRWLSEGTYVWPEAKTGLKRLWGEFSGGRKVVMMGLF